MNKHCFCCGKEVEQQECPKCWSGHVRAGSVDIYWNGFLAKRVDVAWCASCDFVWIVGSDGGRTPLCRECRERHLSVETGAPRETAVAAAA